MAHLATNCHCTSFGPCPICGNDTTTYTTWEPIAENYTAPEPPPNLVPLSEVITLLRPNRHSRRRDKAIQRQVFKKAKRTANDLAR